MAEYTTHDPKLTNDGRYVKQGFSDPEKAPTGQFTSENARIMQVATNQGELKFDGDIGLDAPYTGKDLPHEVFGESTSAE